MHVLEYLHRNVKTVAMPTAMVVGALLCRPISALEDLVRDAVRKSAERVQAELPKFAGDVR